MRNEKNKYEILVVDDTPENLELFSSILFQQGYKVRLVPNGPLALKSMDAAQPDLILLDIKMPGMNGYELCRLLKQDERLKDIPVLFLSALDDMQDKVEAFKAGGLDYITKPFQEEEILARIETHLRLRAYQLEIKKTMAGVGQLAAKIVHEINDPDGFIISNLSILKENTGDLFSLISAYENCIGGDLEQVSGQSRTLREKLDNIKKTHDFDSLKDDIPILIDKCLGSANRINIIASDLMDFSHPEAEG